MSQGLFITFEGGEGTGKSTQIARLAARLKAAGRAVTMTREPGGTDSAEAIRGLLVTGETDSLSPTAEALLNYAARDDHLRRVIRPALKAGHVVLCDRFMDSTRAYQGYAGDCPLSLIDALERDVVGRTRPALTLVFDLPHEAGLARAGARGNGAEGVAEDRFERKGAAFHERLREAFLRIAREEPERCVVIDASGTVDEVEAAVWRAVRSRLEQGA